MLPVDISVVVPTYGGANSIEELIRRIDTTLTAMGLTFEIVVVNDSSPDQTWTVLTGLSESYPDTLRVVDLMNNHGQAVATMCGLANTSGDIVVTMDDDLQHPPEEIPSLLAALQEHPEWDAVIGSWDRDHGMVRSLGSSVHARLDRLAHGTPKGFRLTAFRAMRRPVVDALVRNETRTPAVNPLVLRSARQVHNVSVEHRERPRGSSTFTMRGGISHTWQNFLQGSTFPLRLLSQFGVVASLGAILIGCYQLIRWALGADTPAGWMSSFVATLFFGGTILVGIGLLGEYISLLMKNATQPPRWIVRQTLGFESDASYDARSASAHQSVRVSDNRRNAAGNVNHSRTSDSPGEPDNI